MTTKSRELLAELIEQGVLTEEDALLTDANGFREALAHKLVERVSGTEPRLVILTPKGRRVGGLKGEARGRVRPEALYGKLGERHLARLLGWSGWTFMEKVKPHLLIFRKEDDVYCAAIKFRGLNARTVRRYERIVHARYPNKVLHIFTHRERMCTMEEITGKP